LGADGQSTEQVDAELRRVAEAADGLVRGAEELRAALDSLSESVSTALRESEARAASAPAEPVEQGAPSEGGADEIPEGARIVALDMVLDGGSREDVAARLLAEFGLSDVDALLDDVYARTGA